MSDGWRRHRQVPPGAFVTWPTPTIRTKKHFARHPQLVLKKFKNLWLAEILSFCEAESISLEAAIHSSTIEH